MIPEEAIQDFSQLNLSELSLPQRLEAMRMIDEGLLNATPDQMRQLANGVKEKIDDYYKYKEDLEAYKNRLEMRITPWQQELARAKNDLNRFQKFIDWIMENNDRQEIPGEDYVLKNTTSKRCEIKVEADETFIVRFGRFIRTKYEWNLTEIKKAITADPNHEIATYARMVTNNKAKIDIKKRKRK